MFPPQPLRDLERARVMFTRWLLKRLSLLTGLILHPPNLINAVLSQSVRCGEAPVNSPQDARQGNQEPCNISYAVTPCPAVGKPGNQASVNAGKKFMIEQRNEVVGRCSEYQ